MKTPIPNTVKNFSKKFSRPNPYVLLFSLLFLCAIATYLVPAGEFDRVQKGDISVTIPGSYHAVDPNPTGFIQFFTAIQTGMVDAAPLILLVLFTGGAMAVIEKTGALNAAILSLVNRLGNKEFLLIILVSGLFSFLGTVGVIVNSVIAFIPLGIMIARAMKLDALFGVALIYLGTYAGYNTTIATPSPLGLSQRIAELPLFSGIGFRIVIYLVTTVVTILYISRYARKIKGNPSASILGSDLFPASTGNEEQSEKALGNQTTFTLQQKLILSFAGLTLLSFIICTLLFKWTENEMAGIFIFIAIGVGLIARMGPNEIAKTFLQGCQGLINGALIIGMARSISVVLEDGKLLDTIVNHLAALLNPLTPTLGGIGMFLVSALLHFLISSGSGESVVLVPVLVPLADLLNITRQVAVEAVMLGEGLVNCMNPTSGVLMSILAISGISYGKWLRFILPLLAIWAVLDIVFLIIGISIGWGPY
ncbi:YfcC family protein [Kroppenstedtia sanguinis]|uniref:YfcC family protein n=1 Tax=Kroppenstedtia sanguinis TaxID=1380684 RepID=A0ABW4C592_9BACL